MKNTPLIVYVVLLSNLRPDCGTAQSADLLQYMPRGANAILVVDVDALKKTSLAAKEGWAEKRDVAFAARPVVLPSEARRIVATSLLDPNNELAQIWTLAVMSLHEPISMRSIARAEGGYTDTINEIEAAWTPGESYFVSLAPRMIGIMSPGNRQLVSRWTDFARNNRNVELSPYLQSAARTIGREAQFVIAIDLKDAVQPHRLSEHLDNSAVLQSHKSKAAELTGVLSSIHGVTLKVSVKDKADGALRIDFGQSAAPLANLAKPLVLETFDRYGASLSDLETWRAQVEGTAIVMRGALTTAGMRRLASLLEVPSTKFSTLKNEDISPGSPTALARASLTYYKSVTTLIDDLRETLDDTRDNHAVWMERYGQKIDRLPILNVDEDLLAYGAKVAETFRVMALAKRASGIRSGVRKSRIYGNYQYTGYGSQYGGYAYGVRKSSHVRSQIGREEAAKASKVRFTSWKEIEGATAAIRRDMTKRYQIEF